MASNTAKNILKSAAEVVANTSTILVAGKAIASVVGSTATSVKDMYEEKTIEDVTDDIQTGELIKEEATVSEPLVHKETTNESTVHVQEHNSVKEESDKMVVTDVYNEDTIEKEENLEIVSTEPSDEEIDINPEDVILGEENIPSDETIDEQLEISPFPAPDGWTGCFSSETLTKYNMDQLPDTDLDLSDLDLSKW